MRLAYYLLIVYSIFGGNCSGWVLPPSKFIIEFSDSNNRLAILQYIPIGESIMSTAKYFKSLRYKKSKNFYLGKTGKIGF
jgi:hypothetical protein